MSYWKNNDITSDDVILESVNDFDESATKTKNSVLSLYDKGVFSDENGVISSANKMKILNIFGLSNFESSEDLNELHKTKATKENNNIMQASNQNKQIKTLEFTEIINGEFVTNSNSNNLIGFNNGENAISNLQIDGGKNSDNDKSNYIFMPLEIDDHKIHITEHTRFLISDASNNLSKEYRDLLLRHIQIHKTMSKNN